MENNNVDFYQKLISMSPEERLFEKSGHKTVDTINGILIAYAHQVKIRGGHIDIITNRDAVREIMDLINSCTP